MVRVIGPERWFQWRRIGIVALGLRRRLFPRRPLNASSRIAILFIVPVAFHQFEDVPFAIPEKHDSKSGNEVPQIDDGIRFDAVSPQRSNCRFQLGHIERQVLETD
jgi:hypothetical protein